MLQIYRNRDERLRKQCLTNHIFSKFFFTFYQALYVHITKLAQATRPCLLIGTTELKGY